MFIQMKQAEFFLTTLTRGNRWLFVTDDAKSRTGRIFQHSIQMRWVRSVQFVSEVLKHKTQIEKLIFHSNATRSLLLLLLMSTERMKNDESAVVLWMKILLEKAKEAFLQNFHLKLFINKHKNVTIDRILCVCFLCSNFQKTTNSTGTK